MRRIMFVLVGFLVVSWTLTFSVMQSRAADAPKEIILGVPTSLGSPEGKDGLRAVQLAVEEINKNGVKLGDGSVPFRVEALDIRDSSPGVPVPEALLGLEKIILEKKADAIVVGPFRSEAILAGMDIVAKHRVPMLGAIAASPAYTAKIGKDPKYKYCFRVGGNAIHIVGSVVDGIFMLKQKFGFDKIYILNQDVAWARATAEIVTKIVTGKGLKVVGSERFPTGATQFSSALMKVRASRAPIIAVLFDMPESGTLVKQINAMKIPAVVTGLSAPLAKPQAWKTFEGKIAGLINNMVELSNVRIKKWPKTLAFHDAYEKRWGEPITAVHGPAPAYESVYMLKAAIEGAGSLDPDAIVTELEKTDYMSVLGRTRFNKNHQIVYGKDPKEEALIGNIQWSNTGQRVIVSPAGVADDVVWKPDYVK